MNLVSRSVLVAGIFCMLVAQTSTAQQYGKIPDSQQPPSSMEFVSPLEFHKNNPAETQRPVLQPPLTTPYPGDPGERVLVGTMINGYTSQGARSNQLGYDWENDFISIIFRAGPSEQYPNAGNGSLVLNSSSDGGATWTGNSPIFNEDLPSNILGQELSARHPNIYAMNVEGTTSIATLWGNPYATFLHPNGVYGEICHKSGPLGGAYSSGTLEKDEIMQYFPSRMTADQSGNLYSIFQSLDPEQDLLTGDYYILKSTDHGLSWSYDLANPCLVESELEDNYQVFYSTVNVDVSPDGTAIYVAFLGIFVEEGFFTFTDNRFGYVRSTDGGATWSDPVMYPLYTWDLGETPVNTLDGWMIPSIGIAVDGLNQPHFLISINGRDTFFPLDSTLLGELTINPEDPSEPPKFYALSINTLSDFRRKINPHGATAPAQPTFSIWAEHDWSKTPDGMTLVAKWIDADSIFVTTPDTHPEPFVRDSTHDIYICTKDITALNNGANGWRLDPATNTHDIVNITQSVGVDEKFTKMNPRINPALNKTYFLYTIMATGEFVPGQIYPDTDDQGPAELYLVPFDRLVSPVGELDSYPDGFALMQNFPNPFNPATTIQFSLPTAGMAMVRVMNMLGQEVAVAYSGYTEAGSHALTFDATNLPSGQYVYRLESAGYSVAKMMTLMK